MSHPYHPYKLKRLLSIVNLRRATEVSPTYQTQPDSALVDVEMALDEKQTAPAAESTHPPATPQIQEKQPHTLADILSGKVNDAHLGNDNDPEEDMDEDEPETEAREGYCIECEGASDQTSWILTLGPHRRTFPVIISQDQPAEVICEACSDVYCQVCFQAQHRKGNRRSHKTKPLNEKPRGAVRSKQNLTTINGHHVVAGSSKTVEEEFLDLGPDSAPRSGATTPAPPAPLPSAYQPTVGASVGDWFFERAKYIPMRLTPEERKYLRLLEGALAVSEYTNKIDIISFSSSKPRRVVAQIRELCSVISGLLLAADYNLGQQLFSERNFEANASFYQEARIGFDSGSRTRSTHTIFLQIFEIGRRHKIQNPDRMRDSYGKLIYLLMDAQTPEVQDMLGFSLIDPESPTVRTVYHILEELECLDVLKDDLISAATMEIIAEGKERRQVQKEIKTKERAVETLASKYGGRSMRGERSTKPEMIRQCLYSIGDNHAFLRVNRDPCDKMIQYLKKYFHPTEPKPSLTIRSGRDGARLSHGHEKQYAYVLQSLTLWREILHDMFKLWGLAEQDLLSPTTTYRLRDTGQGLQRVQPCPRTSRIMHSILNKAQQNIGTWVGSSVIHLGDTAVPNALMFIDKYSQIYRILLPITNVLRQIPDLSANPKSQIRSYIDQEFGGTEPLIIEILTDFFRHAFDGSGA
ncbi:hypothetical protein FRB90_000156 [Tulasnella sp. 427]|nr:hypothetical protein FRB90_000156 [Tulasnella sp. 427]